MEGKTWIDPRKGVLTPGQEKFGDDLWVNKGIMEAVDGLAISIADNKGLQAAKEAVIKKLGEDKAEEYVTFLYQVVDAIFVGLGYTEE